MAFTKVEKVAVAVSVAGTVGGIASRIIANSPPFTLNPSNPSPLDRSNQGFLVLGGIGSGALLGGGLALGEPKKVLAGWAIGTFLGAIAGAVVGRQFPFTLNPPGSETPLDLADQGLATAAGGWIGEIVGVFLALTL